ncbi:hypothetical protein GCM10022227_45940 [Streptomyces sedi]
MSGHRSTPGWALSPSAHPTRFAFPGARGSACRFAESDRGRAACRRRLSEECALIADALPRRLARSPTPTDPERGTP